MAIVLNIETSTKVCSVALGKDGKPLAVKESMDEKYTHSENLTTYIQQVLSEAGIELKGIDAVAVSKGPGSYTGLRIGIATAKGLCYALDKPLIGIETLKGMAWSVIAALPGSARAAAMGHRNTSEETGRAGDGAAYFCPMLDARRMEVYCAVYDSSLNEIKSASADIIDENSFSGLLTANRIFFFGEGAEKCKKKLSSCSNALFIDTIFPSAKNLIPFSEEAFRNKNFENTAYFEPFYLKDFVGSKSAG